MKSYDPKISVKLIKVRPRREIKPGIPSKQKTRTSINLTQYFGDVSSIRTSKSTKEPAGTFNITFADRMEKDHSESIYALIEPMDLIEIRAAHEPHLYGGPESWPVLMRGFVSTIQRNEGMDSSGKPGRSVTISGHDYGKIWQIFQIHYISQNKLNEYYFEPWKFFRKFDLNKFNDLPSNQFLSDVIDKILSPWLEELLWDDSSASAAFSDLRVDAKPTGIVPINIVNQWPGGAPIYQMLVKVLDVQNNLHELFTQDFDDHVKVIYRPTPWRDVDGKTKISDYGDIETTEVTDDDLMALTSARSDQAVSNIYWMKAPHFEMENDNLLRLFDGYAPDEGYDNNDPNVFGRRLLRSIPT